MSVVAMCEQRRIVSDSGEESRRQNMQNTGDHVCILFPVLWGTTDGFLKQKQHDMVYVSERRLPAVWRTDRGGCGAEQKQRVLERLTEVPTGNDHGSNWSRKGRNNFGFLKKEIELIGLL